MNNNLGLIGKKLGNTQIFGEDGNVIRVTVIKTLGCRVVGKRTEEKNKYTALQLGFGEKKKKNSSKAQVAFYEKNSLAVPSTTKEFRVAAEDVAKFEVGQALKPSDMFVEGQKVDVTGQSRGRGMTGVMFRWNFKGAATASHGTHEYQRHGGAIGTNMTPGRTLPNVKMPGHYGDERVTALNLKVAKIMDEEGIILVEGAVPGSRGAVVTIRGTVKGKKAAAK